MILQLQKNPHKSYENSKVYREKNAKLMQQQSLNKKKYLLWHMENIYSNISGLSNTFKKHQHILI